MNKNAADIAEAYYIAMGNKNLKEMEKYLHTHVQFTSPLAKLNGKEAILEAAKKFTEAFKSLKIRAKFGSENQAILVFDLEFHGSIGNCPSVSYLTFHEGLISKIELFLDGRLFEKKKEAIFS